jgi:hypothetical protein
LDNVWLFFSCLKSKHFFLFNYVLHLFLLTCVKFHGKKIDNNYTLTYICLLPFSQMASYYSLESFFPDATKIVLFYSYKRSTYFLFFIILHLTTQWKWQVRMLFSALSSQVIFFFKNQNENIFEEISIAPFPWKLNSRSFQI